jgi:hypothetical protein
VEKQVKSGGLHPRKLDDPNAKKLEREKKLKEQQELALIFKPIQGQKIDQGFFNEKVYDNEIRNLALLIIMNFFRN